MEERRSLYGITKIFSFGSNWKKGQNVERVGNKVFENHSFSFYDGLSNNNIFINIIYAFLANHDIATLEQELIARGFAVVDISGIPEELIKRVPHIVCNSDYDKSNVALGKEDAIKFLNKNLPLMVDELSMYLKRK